MKKVLDKYQFIIGTIIILALMIKDTIGAGILTFEVTDNWLPFELTITLYIISIALLARHIYQKKTKDLKKKLFRCYRNTMIETDMLILCHNGGKYGYLLNVI